MARVQACEAPEQGRGARIWGSWRTKGKQERTWHCLHREGPERSRGDRRHAQR